MIYICILAKRFGHCRVFNTVFVALLVPHTTVEICRFYITLHFVNQLYRKY